MDARPADDEGWEVITPTPLNSAEVGYSHFSYEGALTQIGRFMRHALAPPSAPHVPVPVDISGRPRVARSGERERENGSLLAPKPNTPNAQRNCLVFVYACFFSLCGVKCFLRALSSSGG